MEPSKVLIVDDDPAVKKILDSYLRGEGFETIGVSNGKNAIEVAARERPGVILLDLKIPELPGLDVLRRLRERECGCRIIIVSSVVDEIDRVLGLELGADDYVTKPFSPREVAARIKAVLRRPSESAVENGKPDAIVLGDLTLVPSAHELRVGGRPVALSPMEFCILELLALNPRRVFSRRQILERISADAPNISGRTLDSHVAHLRRKLELQTGGERYIETVHGVGYKLSPVSPELDESSMKSS